MQNIYRDRGVETMTADDIRLTKRATAAAGPLTIPSADLRVFLSAFSSLGYQADSLVAGTGLSEAILRDPDARVPCGALGAIIARAMQQRPLKNIGVRIAAETPIGAFPLLDYLVVSSNTVGEGIQQLARYFRLVGNPCELIVREDENPIRVAAVPEDNSFGVEFVLALMVLNLHRETGGRFRAVSVNFAHKADDAQEVERIVGCAVHAEAAWSGLEISREAWQLPFQRKDPVLRLVLERQADEMIARIPAKDGVESEVRRVLAKRVAGGDIRIAAAARDLATTVRTLQRRLAAAGVSYQDLVELARREAAEKYLADLSLSIAEVSYLLGYSEPSALHRAFKRWKHTTPQAFRQAQQAGRSSARASS
jgi:AraC-like DNA-binding protein